jgi:hypothetical protein
MEAELSITDRLENWGLCQRVWRAQGHCMSFEGRYRSPQHWFPPEAHPLVDYADAQLIESAWATLPDCERIVLKSHYCLRWEPRHTCRILRRAIGRILYPLDIPGALHHGAELVLEALARTEFERRQIVRDMARKTLDMPRFLSYNSR